MDVQGYAEAMRLFPWPKDSGDAEAGRRNGQLANGQRQAYSIGAVLLALGFMYSVHNLLAPNMTNVARLFHFNKFERDAYIGGELTLAFYIPGVVGSLVAGVLSGVADRRLLLAVLACLTALACLLTADVGTFRELAWSRAVTGVCIGASLPVVYSLVGDWFPAQQRARATAFVTAASGAGVFLGQCLAAVTGSYDWRWPFMIVAFPAAFCGALIWYIADEPVRGGQEDSIENLYQNTGLQYVPAFSTRHFKAALLNKTNILVILQAFPGNIPWGVIIVYLHDFLKEDLGLSTESALSAIATLSFSAFLGVLTGGFLGESLYGANSRHLAIFGGVCNIVRAVPFYIIFGWVRLFGPLERTSESIFFVILIIGGFVATMASPGTGAMLLNVNLPETRGSVVALYSVLDDLSKGFGTLFVSMIVPLVGGRAWAYQFSLMLWVFTGVALLYTWYTLEDDERQMRRHLDEAAMESMVHLSKQRAQQAVKDHAKRAGQAHFAESSNSIAAHRGRRPFAAGLNLPRPTQVRT